MSIPRLIVIVGPTASGKSDAAVEVALRLNGEIISADSRQVYRGLDIGSGKVPRDGTRGKRKEEGGRFFYRNVRHHLLGVASPKRTFTVAQYRQKALAAMKDIIRRGSIPIIAGGTGFYIDALLWNINIPEVKPNPALRKKLEKLSTEELFAMLKAKDSVRAKGIDPKNPRRLVRALEIVNAIGKVPAPPRSRTLSPPLQQLGIKNSNVLMMGIAPPRETLHQNIHRRLLARIREGMIGEVRLLHRSGVSWRRLDDLGLEYRYMSRYLRGILTKKEMFAALEQEIRNYAKRQMTWWKRNKNIRWFPDPQSAVSFIEQCIKRDGPHTVLDAGV